MRAGCRVLLVILSAVGRLAGVEDPAKDLTPQERQRMEQDAQQLDAKGAKLYAAGNLVEATELARQVLAVRHKLYPVAKFPDGHADLAASLNNLGILLQVQARPAQALPYCEQALAMCQKLYPAAKFPDGHPHLAGSLNSLAGVLEAQGRSAQALPYREQALAMYRKLYPAAKFPVGHPDLAASLNLVGFLLQGQGRSAQALPYLEQALAMRQKLHPAAKFPDGHPDLATSLNNLGGLLLAQGRYTQALPYCEQALAMLQKLYPADKFRDGHPNLAMSLNNLGHLLYAQGRSAQALPYVEQAMAMWSRQAERLAQAATESDALAHARSLPLPQDLLLSVSRHLPDTADHTYTLLWSGRAALTRIWQYHHLATAAVAGRPEHRDRWAELLDTRRRLARLLLKPLPPNPADRSRAVQALTDRKEHLERELIRNLPALAVAKDDRPGPAVLQAQLPTRAAFLDLFRYVQFEHDPQVAGKEGQRRTPCYVAFVMQPGRPIQRVELGEAVPIEQALDTWRRAIAERRDSPAAGRLRRLLWEPLARHLAAVTESVYLAPDGALTRLPWAALPGSRPGTVLLEEYTLGVVEHGPHLLAGLRRPVPSAARAGTLLVVGGVRYDEAPAPVPRPREDVLAKRGPDRDGPAGRWPYLAGSAREVRLVRVAVGARPVTVLDGTAAGTGQLLRELPHARIAHLATHGFFNEHAFREEQRRQEEFLRNWSFQLNQSTVLAGQGARSPLSYTGLVLAGANVPERAGPEGGILTGEYLLEQPLEGLELAVLSACQTGLGELAGSQCVQNLGQALHAAGCRDVVASLWNVPDDATAALMALFYDELLTKGRPPLEALRQAQLYVFRHPDQVKEVAERGPPRRDVVAKVPEGAAPPVAERRARAAVKDWAGFFLSGPGR